MNEEPQKTACFLTNLDPEQDNGYDQKLIGQVKAFESSGYQVSLIARQNNKWRFWEVLETGGVQAAGKIGGFLALAWMMLFLKEQYSFVYLRLPRLSPSNLILTILIRRNTRVVVSEVPTYPNLPELKKMKGLKKYYFIFWERVLRRTIDALISKYAFIGQLAVPDDKFIRIGNGSMKYCSQTVSFKPFDKIDICDRSVRFVFVGNFNSFYQRFGLDRFLSGINSLPPRERSRVELNIIGCKEAEFPYQIPENLDIIFHGRISSHNMIGYLHSFDCGIGALGFHRVGIFDAAPLKERDYAAALLPYMSSVNDYQLGDRPNFRMQVNPTDGDIDIEKAIEFTFSYWRSEKKQKSYELSVEEFLSWDKAMMGVTQYLKNELS